MVDQVKMTGLKETVAALRALPKDLSGHNGGPVRAGVAAAARVIRNEAIVLAPIKTGNLRKQIYMYRDREPPSGVAERYIVSVRTGRRSKRVNKSYARKVIGSALRTLAGNDAWYWYWVEFGTSKMRAQPFMRPAFESQKERAVKEFEKIFVKGVERAEAFAKQKAGA